MKSHVNRAKVDLGKLGESLIPKYLGRYSLITTLLRIPVYGVLVEMEIPGSPGLECFLAGFR